MKYLLTSVAAPLALCAAIAHADPVKVGVLTDLSGSVSDLTGEGAVTAARMAIEDFGAEHPEMEIELISADHQMKPDIGLSVARRWFDEDGVDAIADLSGSAVALAVVELARERNKVALNTGGGASIMSGEKCSPTAVQWAYDSWSQADALGRTLTREGAESWFFITADYAFGDALQTDMTAAIEAEGGRVLGSVRAPLGTLDYSSALLQAQASGAHTIAIATVAGDLITAVKQANEFGIVASGQQLAVPTIFSSDIRAIGLDLAQGLLLAAPYYPARDEAAKAWSDRFTDEYGRVPTFLQASVYSAVLGYLRAIDAAGTQDGKAVMAKLHELPTDDPIFGKGKLMPNGRHAHPLYLLKVRGAGEGEGDWDIFEQVAEVSAEDAVRPMAETGCPLVQ